MNLFRSEEHVRRWPLYYQLAEDYILPVREWVEVFSGPLFRERLAPDYLHRGPEYVEQYHAALKIVGKASPFWQYPMIAALQEVRLSRYRVVGDYTRYGESVINALKDARQSMITDLETGSHQRKNYLIWAAPGSGKTYFMQQIARDLGDRCQYLEVNLAKQDEASFRTALEAALDKDQPTLCLIDEADAKPDAGWPYEVLLSFLDQALERQPSAIFVLAGSGGSSLEAMKEGIGRRPKGADVLSRIPVQNQFVIPPLAFGDRVLVVLSQFVAAGLQSGRTIRAVEKLGLYYVALNAKLTNARQLREFAVRAVERIPRGEDRVKYDHLFVPGDPENKRFWLEVSPVARELVNSYVQVDAS